MADEVIRFVTVDGGHEVARLARRPDGSVAGESDHPVAIVARSLAGTAEEILQTRMREQGETAAEAFAGLRRDGWSNAHTMIALDSPTAA